MASARSGARGLQETIRAALYWRSALARALPGDGIVGDHAAAMAAIGRLRLGDVAGFDAWLRTHPTPLGRRRFSTALRQRRFARARVRVDLSASTAERLRDYSHERGVSMDAAVADLLASVRG